MISAARKRATTLAASIGGLVFVGVASMTTLSAIAATELTLSGSCISDSVGKEYDGTSSVPATYAINFDFDQASRDAIGTQDVYVAMYVVEFIDSETESASNAVGSNLAMTQVTLAGEDSVNFSITTPDITGDLFEGCQSATISQKILTVENVTAQSRKFNGRTTVALNASLAKLSGGIVAGEVVNLDTSLAVGVFEDKNVGSGKTVATSGFAIDDENYLLIQPEATADISKASAPVVTPTGSKVYGETFAPSGTIYSPEPSPSPTPGPRVPSFTVSNLQFGDEAVSVDYLLLDSQGGAAGSPVGDQYSIASLGLESSKTSGGFAAENYEAVLYEPGKLTVTKAELTITASNGNKTYGANDTATYGSGKDTFTSSGLQNDEAIGSVTLTVSDNGATSSAAADSYEITPSAAVSSDSFSPSNYEIRYSPGTYLVAPALLEIKASNGNKTYGVDDTSNYGPGMTAFSHSSLQNGEDIGSVTLTVTNNGDGPLANATSVDSEIAYVITPSAPVGSPSFSSSNYAIDYIDGTYAVDPAELTVTANDGTKTYGDSSIGYKNSDGSFLITGDLKNGDEIASVTLSPNVRIVTTDASTYPVTPSEAVGSFNADNYSIMYSTGNVTVAPALLEIKASNGNKTYGVDDTSNYGPGMTAFSHSSLQNGEDIGSVTLTVTNNGDGPLANATSVDSEIAYVITPSAPVGSPSFSSSNYAIDYIDGTYAVDPAELTVTANDGTKTYGDSSIGYNNLDGPFLITGDLKNGEAIDAVTLSPDVSIVTTDASTYLVTPSEAVGSFNANNYAIKYLTGNVTVTPSALGIRANSGTKTYGDSTIGYANEGGSFLITGELKNGDEIASVTLSPNIADSATDAAESITVTPKDAVGLFNANNYAIKYLTGNVTVNKAALTITANDGTKTYGNSSATYASGSSFITSELVNGESVTSISFKGSGLDKTANVGDYVMTPDNPLGTEGFNSSNYEISYDPGNVTVDPAVLTITVSDASRTYGDASISYESGLASYTQTGLQNSDSIEGLSLSFGSSAFSVTAAAGSTHKITASNAAGSFSTNNYEIKYVAGNVTVIPAALTITATNSSKTYGDVDSNFGSGKTAGYSGLKNSESIGSVTLTVSGNGSGNGDNSSADAGSYVITPSAALGGSFNSSNYTIGYVDGIYTVDPAALTITASNGTKTYGDSSIDYQGPFFFDSPCLFLFPPCHGVDFFVSEDQEPSWFVVLGELKNGEAIDAVTLSPDLTSATTDASMTPYKVTPSAAVGTLGFNPNNYDIKYVVGNVTVDPAVLTIRASDSTKTYGNVDSNFGPGQTAGYSGLKNSESIGSVTLNVSNDGDISSAAAGSYVITPSLAEGGTFSPGNYTIGYLDGTYTVDPAALTITASNGTKTYGDSSIDYQGPFFFDSPCLFLFPPCHGVDFFVSEDQEPSWFVVLGELKNGEAIDAVTLSPDLTSATTDASMAPYDVTPSAAVGTLGFNPNNYDIKYVVGNVTVDPAVLTIRASDSTKTYGNVDSNFGPGQTAGYSGLKNSESIGSVTLNVSNDGDISSAAAGSYVITPSLAEGGTFSPGNYTIGYLDGTYTVDPAVLTITASNGTKIYGTDDTANYGSGKTAIYSGLKNSEFIGSVTLTVSNAGDTSSAAAGSYDITPSAALGEVSRVELASLDSVPIANFASSDATAFKPSNYTIQYRTGNYTVDPAALTIEASNSNKTYGTYDTTNFGPGKNAFSSSGLQNGEVIGSVTLDVSNDGDTSSAAAGSYDITPSAALGEASRVELKRVDSVPIVSFASSDIAAFSPSNYTIRYLTGNYTVTPATVTITANSVTKTVGDDDTTNYGSGKNAFSSSGLQNDEAIGSVTLIVVDNGDAASAVAGSYDITPSDPSGGTFNPSNYTFSFNKGTLTVQAVIQAPSGGGAAATPEPEPLETTAPEPTPPIETVTAPAGSVEGSDETLKISSNEEDGSVMVSGADWQLEVASKKESGESQPSDEDKRLVLQTGTRVALAAEGLMPESTVAFWVFSDPTYVGEVQTDGTGKLDSDFEFPESILPGEHTLQMLSRDALGRAITLNFPITVKGDEVSETLSSSQKVNAGSFKGYVAIYAKGYQGQRLSAKVGNDWVIVPGIPAANNNLYRHVEYVGADVDVAVRIYIDRVLIDTINLRTK